MAEALEMSLSELFAGDAPLPRSMIVQAHPDDEVIGIGSQLPRLRDSLFVHTTNGAPASGTDAAANGFAAPEAYARARREELIAAMSIAGVLPQRLLALEHPDQQVSFRMPHLARQIAELIHLHRPAMVLTHPFEGGHPDHDATCFAVHAACMLLAGRGDCAPPLYEISSYHNGPAGLTPCCFIAPNTDEQVLDEIVLLIDARQAQMKRRMFAAFGTQQETLRYFPIGKECIRRAPRYCFTRPAHQGMLFYEMYDWGMTGARFIALAGDAITELGLEEVL